MSGPEHNPADDIPADKIDYLEWQVRELTATVAELTARCERLEELYREARLSDRRTFENRLMHDMCQAQPANYNQLKEEKTHLLRRHDEQTETALAVAKEHP